MIALYQRKVSLHVRPNCALLFSTCSPWHFIALWRCSSVPEFEPSSCAELHPLSKCYLLQFSFSVLERNCARTLNLAWSSLFGVRQRIVEIWEEGEKPFRFQHNEDRDENHGHEAHWANHKEWNYDAIFVLSIAQKAPTVWVRTVW